MSGTGRSVFDPWAPADPGGEERARPWSGGGPLTAPVAPPEGSQVRPPQDGASTSRPEISDLPGGSGWARPFLPTPSNRDRTRAWTGWLGRAPPRPLLVAGGLLVAALALGASAFALDFGGPVPPEGPTLQVAVLGAAALTLAGGSEVLLYREARRERYGLQALDFLRQVPVAMVLLDEGWRVQRTSPQGEVRAAAMGLPPPGASILDLARGQGREALRRALRSASPSSFVLEVPPWEGGLDPLSVNVVVGGFDPRSRSRVLVLLDVTDRTRLVHALTDLGAALARSNRELEQFAYVASHDLQEPLRMIASYTQLLQDRYGALLDAEGGEFLGYAREGAVRMQRLIDDLLLYARLGRASRPFRVVPFGEALEEALMNLRGAVVGSQAAITHDPLPEVVGDRGQLVQLLQNLLANALKFHGAEPPRIHVGVRHVAGERCFSVEDRGIGIAPEDHARIFEPFRRLHPREAYPGSGIGLAICRKIVEHHHGRIWVESSGEAGGTTAFRFTLEEGARPGVPPEVGPVRLRAAQGSVRSPGSEGEARDLIEERLRALV